MNNKTMNATLTKPIPSADLTFGARLEKVVVGDGVRAVRRFQVRPQPFGRLDRHLYTVLQHRHRKHVRGVRRAPQPKRLVCDVRVQAFRLAPRKVGR